MGRITNTASEGWEQLGVQVQGSEHRSPQKSLSDVPGSVPEQRLGLQEGPLPYLSLPPRAPWPPPPDATRPAAGIFEPYLPPSNTHGSIYEPHQNEDIRTSANGHSQGSSSPNPYYPLNESAPSPPPPRYVPDSFPNKTRIVTHRFAGFVFKIRTDAEVSSKKLRVKPVDNHVEYYCSDVLLTKIKYKYERDIFSLYEDPNAEPLRDVKLCEKIEILMGPIIARILEKPWDSSYLRRGWGVRACESIGDGNLFEVDVFEGSDAGDSYDLQSRAFQPSTTEKSRPIVSYIDAFHRKRSNERTRHRSRSRLVHRSIDRIQLLDVLREVELRTAIELAKQSYVSGSAVASIIGTKDYQLCRRTYDVFSVEVPTLFGLLVSKIPRWASKSPGSSPHFGFPRLRRRRKYAIEAPDYELPNASESFMTHSSDIHTSVESDIDTLAFPVAPNSSAGPGDFVSGLQDEEENSLDGESSSDDLPFAHHVVDSNSKNYEEDGSGRHFHNSDEGLLPHLDNYKDSLLIAGNTSRTESIQLDTFIPINESYPNEPERPPHAVAHQNPVPNPPTKFHSVAKTIVLPVGSNSKKGEDAPRESIAPGELKNLENEGSSPKDCVTTSPGSPSHMLDFPTISTVGPSSNTECISPPIQAVPEKPITKKQHVDARKDIKEAETSVSNAHGHTKSLHGKISRTHEDDSYFPSSQEKVMMPQREHDDKNKGEKDHEDKSKTQSSVVFAHESDDIPLQPLPLLHQPQIADDGVEKIGRNVMFAVSSEHTMLDGRKGGIRHEDTRHKDEFNEARRAHLKAAHPTNPIQDNSLVHSHLSQAAPLQSSSYYSNQIQSIVEPYQEAVAAGQIYESATDTSTIFHTSGESQKYGRPSHSLSGSHDMSGSHSHYTPPIVPPPDVSSYTGFDSLPIPATSPKRAHLFSRKKSHKHKHHGYLSSGTKSSTEYYWRKKRLSRTIAKDTLSVTLGVVIVILAILAVALDPAEEENWFKRIEEGVFVMFSLGIPLLLAMRSRLTDNLEVMLPRLTKEVRSLRDLENMHKGMTRKEFMKHLQRELLLNERLSRLFSPENASYKLSRESGNLVVPERAEYRKIFKEVWFFGEELAYNKMLGKAFRYQQKDNVLMIESESVDIEGIIVHTRRRRGKYTFGSAPER